MTFILILCFWLRPRLFACLYTCRKYVPTTYIRYTSHSIHLSPFVMWANKGFWLCTSACFWAICLLVRPSAWHPVGSFIFCSATFFDFLIHFQFSLFYNPKCNKMKEKREKSWYSLQYFVSTSLGHAHHECSIIRPHPLFYMK